MPGVRPMMIAYCSAVWQPHLLYRYYGNSKWAPDSIFYLSMSSAFHRLNQQEVSHNFVLNRILLPHENAFLCCGRTCSWLFISLKSELQNRFIWQQDRNDVLALRKQSNVISGYDLTDICLTTFIILPGIFILFFCEKTLNVICRAQANETG